MTDPRIFLDMDGCIADYFGEWSKMHNVDHWKSIQNKENSYIELAHSSYEIVYNFFTSLPTLSGGMKVVDWLNQKKIDFTILSSPFVGPNKEASILAKKVWLEKYIPNKSDTAIFSHEKHFYAKNNVLIDDFGPNLNLWKEHGGIPVKFEDEYEDSESYLKVIKNLEIILNS